MTAMTAGGSSTYGSQVTVGEAVATPAITRLTSSVWLVSAIGERKSGTKSLATRSVAEALPAQPGPDQRQRRPHRHR